MGMRRFAQQADAQSKETGFAGLPKSIVAYPSAGVNTAAGVYVGMSINTIYKNYGGYTLGGGAVIIAEPGIHLVGLQTSWVGGAAYIGHAVALNGVVSGSLNGLLDTRTNTAGVTNPVMTTSGLMELAAGDTLAIFVIGPGINAVSGAGQSFITVCKLGGQY